MTNRSVVSKGWLIVLLFLTGQWLALTAHASGETERIQQPTTSSQKISPFTFEPARPDVDTGERLELSVSGTQGKVLWKAQKGEIQGWGNHVIYVAPPGPGPDIITVTDANDQQGILNIEVTGYLDLTFTKVLFLFVVGFIGGLVSGFIGSGGAFVLTPAMMSMGVPGVVAVASNICHKFPKALVGAMKRAKYGQVDVKLGLVLGLSAEVGVLLGAEIQTMIKQAMGDAGSNLYVSFVFVVVLAIVGSYVLRDAWKIYRSGSEEEKVSSWALKIRAWRVPGTMVYFKSMDAEVSWLVTVPIGFFTGMLAATIAVGGFIGVPSMIYLLGLPSLMASATELVIAFVMGLGGSIKYAWSGFVDIRLAMIILAGSLFGIQLGAIGTTYVKPYMVKVVMGVIMILVLLSRGIVIPVYLSSLGYIGELGTTTAKILEGVSFTLLIAALAIGAIIILYALWQGHKEHLVQLKVEARAGLVESFSLPDAAEIATTQLSPFGRFNRLLLVTDGSEYSGGAEREAIQLAQKIKRRLFVMSVVRTNPEYESLAPQLFEKEQGEAIAHLKRVKTASQEAGVDCEMLLRYGEEVYQEVITEAGRSQIDVIIMGRRGKGGMMRALVGGTTARVIGHTLSSVLVVPRKAHITGKTILLAADGSRYSDVAAVAATQIAKHLNAPIKVVSVVEHAERQQVEGEGIIERICSLVAKEGVVVSGQIAVGKPAEAIVETAKAQQADLIIVGTHGRTGLEKILMGSVSDRVIGLAECAVLVVKA